MHKKRWWGKSIQLVFSHQHSWKAAVHKTFTSASHRSSSRTWKERQTSQELQDGEIFLFQRAALGLLMCHRSAETTGHLAGPYHASNPSRHAEIFCLSQIKIRKAKARIVKHQFLVRKPQRSLPKPGQYFSLIPNKSYQIKKPPTNTTPRPRYLDVSIQIRSAVTKNKTNAGCDGS